MSDTDRSTFWDGVYTTRADTAVSWFEETPDVSLDLLERIGAGPEDAVLDVGGGASRLVDALLARGFRDVTVLDVSEAALATARRRLGAAAEGVRWIAADATRWTPDRTYAVWHDRAAFHFLVDPADRARYRARLLAAVPVGGHVVLGTFAPEGPEKCSGLPVVRQDPERLATFLGPPFALLESRRHVHRTPGGRPQAFRFAAFRRIA